jgi:predicted protein tyrosine phosphatase
MLSICGLEELEQHVGLPVTHAISILDPDHPDPPLFGGFSGLTRLVLRFHDALEATPGQILPQRAHVEEILAFGTALKAATEGAGAHLLVHCHAGISRSTAAMTTLLAQLSPERSSEDIVKHIVDIRTKAWPNLRMIESADDLLGRDGTLIAAVARLYAVQLERFPNIAEFMRNNGRSREVELAARAPALSRA